MSTHPRPRRPRPGRPIVGALVGCAMALASAATVTAGPSGGALPPVLIQVLDVRGTSVVADDAAMVAVNITATRGAGTGYFAAFPCDGPEPLTSNVNYLADQNVPNFALVRIAADGTICIATSEIADLIVDIVGYVPTGSTVTPLDQPIRAADTRATATLPAGGTLRVDARSVSGVDAAATAVMANITALNRSQVTGFLTAHPCRPTPPGTSSVNYGPGATRANFVATRLDTTGAFCVTTSQAADVIVDIAAWDTTGVRTLPEPVRVVDTRTSGLVQPGRPLQLDIAGRPDVPDDATAAVYNLTAANAAGVGFATSHPCLGLPPTASNLNFVAGPPVANGTITKLSGTGRLCIDVSTPTNLIVDLIGFTVGTDDYVPTTPTRIHDSRRGWQASCSWVIDTGINAAPAYLLNVATGVRLTVPVPIGNDRSDLAIDADCAGLIWFDHTSVNSVRRYDFGTRAVSTVLTPPERIDTGPTRSVVAELSGGGFVLSDGYRVIDLSTGDPLLAPSAPHMVGAQVISTGGVWARALLDDFGPHYVEYWDISTGTRLGELTLEEGERLRSMTFSTHDLYVALNVADEATSDPTQRHWVLISTIFGDVVDAVRGGVGLDARFAGRGTLHLCAQGIGLFRWDLFGDIAELGIAGWSPDPTCRRA